MHKRSLHSVVTTICLLALSLAAAEGGRAVAEAAFDEFVSRNFAALAKRFSPEMAAALPAEKAAAQLGPVVDSLGRQVGPRPEPRLSLAGGMEVYIFPCEFEKARVNLLIAVNAAGQVAGLRLLPPDPAAVEPGELAVVTGDVRLPATLTLPEGKGPFPVVVFIHGSGPHDRDETVGANAPFRDLAEGLAARGIASLRYEKRTRQYPGRAVATVKDEVMDDVLSAVALVGNRSEIDPKRIYLLGHSLGGYLIPRLAPLVPAAAGFIMLAANVRPIEELAADQIKYLGAPPETLSQLKQSAPASYWEDLTNYDPVAEARKISAPLLVLQGERDYQVTMKDFEIWRTALAGRPNVVMRSFPKLNHLFLEGEGKSLPAEYGRPGRIPDYVLDEIAAFVNGRRTPQSAP